MIMRYPTLNDVENLDADQMDPEDIFTMIKNF